MNENPFDSDDAALIAEINATQGKPRDPVKIATLAAHFLPKMEVPESWQAMEPAALREALQTSPKTEEITPFEVLAEAAIDRANILLDAAFGIRQQQHAAEQLRTAIEGKQKAFLKEQAIQSGAWKIGDPRLEALFEMTMEERERLRKYYNKEAKGSKPLPLDKVLTKAAHASEHRVSSPAMLTAFIADYRKANPDVPNVIGLFDSFFHHYWGKKHWLDNHKKYAAKLKSEAGKATKNLINGGSKNPNDERQQKTDYAPAFVAPRK